MPDYALPAGLVDHNYEFFVDSDVQAFCLTHGHVTAFRDFSEPLLHTIESQMQAFPVKLAAYRDMYFSMHGRLPGRLDMIRQFLICNYGAFDTNPDMIEGILQPTEYTPCPFRGSCRYEGRGCDGLLTASGQRLSPREIQIIQLIAKGELDKEIAAQLSLSLATVTTHTRNIRRKTGLQRKADFTRFAHQKHLI